MKKILALLMVFVLAFSFCACGGGDEAEAVHLSLGHTNNLDHHYQVLSEDFKKIVEEKTAGQIVIDIYPAEQLGPGAEMLESVKSGTQDLVLDPDAYLANYDARFNAIGMPYVFSGWDDVRNLPGSEAAKTMEAIAEEQGMKILGWAANGFRVFSSNSAIEGPEDFAGLKIRTGSAKLIADMLTELKANSTTLSSSDTYSGIQTGIVDGAENSLTNMIGVKWYEVQSHMAITYHQYTSEPLIMNKAKFDSLSPEFQQIILDAAAEVCAADVETCAAAAEEEIKFIEEQGLVVTYPDAAEMEKALQPVTDKYLAEYGDEFTELYNQLKNLK